MSQQTRDLNIKKIHPNPRQPRRRFNAERLQSLAETIREHGLIQPLVVMPDEGDGYMLLAGERRWRAAQLAGCKTLPCIIRSRANSDPVTVMTLALIENGEREALSPLEEARAYGYLRDELGLSLDEIAAKVKPKLKHGRAYVEARLIWLEVEAEIQDLVEDELLPRDRRVAEALLTIPDKQQRLKLAKRLAGEGAKIETIERACAKLAAHLADRQTSQKKCPMHLKAREKSRQDLDAKQSIPATTLRDCARAMCAACEVNATVLSNRIAEPAWQLLITAAENTCDECGGRAVVGVCNLCPGVEMLRQVITQQAGQGDRRGH